MDPIYAPGVSTPVRHGLNKDEVFKIFRFLFENYFISSVDVVEFNPVNDINGKTGEIVNEIVEYVVNPY